MRAVGLTCQAPLWSQGNGARRAWVPVCRCGAPGKTGSGRGLRVAAGWGRVPRQLPTSAFTRPQFEWAWQHPSASRRLVHVGRRVRSETSFAFHLRVLAAMLRSPPWVRLPLTLRWLCPDFCRDLCPPPPPHVPLAFGPPPIPQALKDCTQARDQGAGDQCTLCACALQVSSPLGSEARGSEGCGWGCLLRGHPGTSVLCSTWGHSWTHN